MLSPPIQDAGTPAWQGALTHTTAEGSPGGVLILRANTTPQRQLLGRAAHGPVSLRKMACGPLRGRAKAWGTFVPFKAIDARTYSASLHRSAAC